MEKREWLKNLKVGDEVFVDTTRFQCLSGFIDKITRETKLYWLVNDYKFRKDDGKEPGNGWNRAKLEMATEELKNKITILNLKKEIYDLRGKLKLPNDIEKLSALRDTLKLFK